MSDLMLIFWWVLMVIGLVGSAIYSGLETGTYSLNRVRLHVLDQQKVISAKRLARLMSQPASLLATLLIGNNITNYLGTAGLTVILENGQLVYWKIILFNVMFLTPLLFVFGETLPKDVFAAHCDKLMYRMSGFLLFSQKLFRAVGLELLIMGLIRLLLRATGAPRKMVALHPRRKFEFLVKEGMEFGLLSEEQVAMVDRVLELSGRQVIHEMVPWSRVSIININDDATKLWKLTEDTGRSRFPVVDSGSQVVGVVCMTDALMYEKSQVPPIHELMISPLVLDATMPLRAALSQLQKSHTALAIANNGDRAIGIVTVKDLVEPIVGELANW